jgi:hypothetical protein
MEQFYITNIDYCSVYDSKLNQLNHQPLWNTVVLLLSCQCSLYWKVAAQQKSGLAVRNRIILKRLFLIFINLTSTMQLYRLKWIKNSDIPSCEKKLKIWVFSVKSDFFRCWPKIAKRKPQLSNIQFSLNTALLIPVRSEQIV